MQGWRGGSGCHAGVEGGMGCHAGVEGLSCRGGGADGLSGRSGEGDRLLYRGGGGESCHALTVQHTAGLLDMCRCTVAGSNPSPGLDAVGAREGVARNSEQAGPH